MQLSKFLASFGVFVLAFGFARSSGAANICNETVPSNRIIDGLPAYSQCTAASSASIYSNNGIDTATASGGTGWVRTQMGGGYQCTEWAHRYLYFKWNVQSVPNGNAGTWCDGTLPAGLVKATAPVHGDLIVFAPGSCGADATTGHVAVIDVVNTNATVTFVEQNSAGRRSCANSTAACFLHAAANNGSELDGGIPDSAQPDTGATSNSDTPSRSDTSADNRADAVSTGGTTTATGGVTASGGVTGKGGATGSGGTSGTGGANGNGGTSGTGGVLAGNGGTGAGGISSVGGATVSGGASGAGGRAGTGGATTTLVASSGGSAGTTSSTGPSASSGNGCSCRLSAGGHPGERAAGWSVLLVVALATTLVISRRRRAHRSKAEAQAPRSPA